MMPVILSPLARQDVDRIWDYVARENLDAAERLIDMLQAAFSRLAAYPQLGRQRADLTARPLRFLPANGYLIVYHEAPAAVLVLRVLSGYQDIASILAKTT